jgi:phosphoesterase RecJ-like protein
MNRTGAVMRRFAREATMTPPDEKILDAAVGLLVRAKRTLITTHARPDGDAIGSTVALWRVLNEVGRRAELVWIDEPSPRYSFLVEGVPWHHWGRTFTRSNIQAGDLMCIVDTCAWNQLEPLDEVLKEALNTRLVIDHHKTRDAIGAVEVVDESAAAAAQVVLALCRHAGWMISPPTARALFAGLATDTGWFKFASVNEAVFNDAAELIRLGAVPSELYERLYQQDAAARLYLMGRLLSSMQVQAEGRVAVMKLPLGLMTECGATPAMTEELVNEPMRIGSVMVSLLFSETEGGVIRVSLRSRHGPDVAALARRFGGGGHSQAAGVRIRGALDEVVGKVVAALLAELDH